MSNKPQLPSSNVFNPSLFDFQSDTLTLEQADLRYVKIGGDITANIINAQAYQLNGSTLSLTNLTYLDSITPGTASASKALVLDSNRDITNIRNLTSNGTITSNISISATPSVGTNSTRLATTEFVQSEFLDRASSTFSPSGFQNQTDSVINYDASTRILTISPVSSSFTVWVKGTKYVYSSTQTASVHTNAVNTYIYYFDDSGVLQWTTTTPSYANPFVADVYFFDATHTLVLDERHGAEMDAKTHIELHNTQGTWYKSGLALSGYTVAPATPVTGDNTFASSSGIIMDEDLASTIGAVVDGGPYTVMYMTGASSQWTFSFGNSVPYNYGTYLKYNQWNGSTWLMTDVTSGDFVNYYVVYLPSIQSALQMVLIPSQTVYNSQANAVAEDFSDLSVGLLSSQIPEYLVRYRITFRAGSGYSSAGKVRIQQLDMIVGSRAIIQNAVATNHQSLSGLLLASSGNQYGHIDDQAQTIAGVKTFSDNPILTLATVSQPNITSVGTLTSLAITSSANNPLTITQSNTANLANIMFSASGTTNTEFGTRGSTASALANHLYLYRGGYKLLMNNTGQFAIGGSTPTEAFDVQIGSINTSTSYKIAGTTVLSSSGFTGSVLTASQPNITSLGTLGQLLVAGYQYSAWTTVSDQNSTLDKYNIQLRATTSTIGDRNGIGFLMLNSGNTVTTPQACISCVRGTQYDGSLVFATKSTNTLTGPCVDRLVIASDGAIVATNDSYYHFTQNSTTTSGFIHQVTTQNNCVPLLTEANGKTFAINLAPTSATLDTNTGVLYLGVNGSPYWRIENNGYITPFTNTTTARIGIQTQSPACPLHIGGSTVSDHIIGVYWDGGSTGTSDFYGIGTNNGALELQGNSVTIHSSSKGNSLGQTCAQFHTVSSSGKVSIGGTQGQMDLNILRTAGALRIGASEATNNACTIQWNQIGANSSSNYLSFDPYGTSKTLVVGMGGYVLMNEIPSNGRGAFHVANYATFTYASSKQYNISTNSYSTISSSTIDLSIYCTKNIWCETIIACSSDRRFKTSIMDYIISDEDYLSLKPKRYIKDNTWQIGLVAQDIVQSMPDFYPDLISPVPNKDMKREDDNDPDNGFAWSLNYDRVTIVNLYMIKKLLKRIQDLEENVNNLQNNVCDCIDCASNKKSQPVRKNRVAYL